jgi:hypothetical protein
MDFVHKLLGWSGGVSAASDLLSATPVVVAITVLLAFPCLFLLKNGESNFLWDVVARRQVNLRFPGGSWQERTESKLALLLHTAARVEESD